MAGKVTLGIEEGDDLVGGACPRGQGAAVGAAEGGAAEDQVGARRSGRGRAAAMAATSGRCRRARMVRIRRVQSGWATEATETPPDDRAAVAPGVEEIVNRGARGVGEDVEAVELLDGAVVGRSVRRRPIPGLGSMA